MDDALRDHVERREEALRRIRGLLVERLRVPLALDQIDLDAPLFGTGLGLDSVDAIELVVALETEFALQIPEGMAGPWHFRTVHSLVEFVLDPPLPPPDAGGADESTPEPATPDGAVR